MISPTQKNPYLHFLHEESGAATPLAIGFAIIFIVLGGIALDFNKAVAERTQMQMATDSAAHAALYTWEFEDTQTSTTTAMATINGMLPDVAFRDALLASDINYGYWDPALASFTIDAGFEEDREDPRRSAVQAFAELEPSRGNESKNILLSIIGWDTFTIRASSVYASYYPPCFTEGFVGDDIVDMQSNSSYLDGFCMHSNTHVSLNQNNFFESGTVVSMPTLADLDIPESGFEKNEGLQAALRQGSHRLRILRQMPMMYESLRTGNPKFAEMAEVTERDTPLYPLDLAGNGANAGPTEEEVMAAMAAMESGNEIPMDALPRMNSNDTGKKTVVPINFAPRKRIFRAECTGNGDITFTAGHYEDFVLVTDCPIKFANNVVLDGVLIATEADVSASILQIGLDDNCAADGNASIWTMGSFNSAANLSGYGAQILAYGDIDFTANAGGLEGVSFITFGKIEGTSEGAMGYCNGQGTENFAVAPYFRMVN